MKVSVLPNTLMFEGILDEETVPGDLTAAHSKLTSAGISPPVTVDFSRVEYANSIGVVVWLKFTIESSLSFKYVNVPVWLVNQFNMIKGYFENGSFVETVQLPFFCPKTQESRAFTMQLGKEIPILADYSNLKLSMMRFDGKEYELDVNPERYFSFISENFELFKEKIK